jgi:hypothetical protein
MPEQVFRELVVSQGFRAFTILRRASNLRTATPGSEVIAFRAYST